MRNNPVIRADYPDLDVIRVGDTYYMISTTTHFFPGGVILRSHDLIHWETAAHIYDALDHTPAQRMEDGWMYAHGMWAASLRWHGGLFHALFCANDTHKMYYYTAETVEGEWTRQPMEGFYHDNSVLFDDDGRVYIVYGGRDIHLTEMESDLSKPKAGGLDKIILSDSQPGLGYEGSHLYKINGKYYIFLIHWPVGHMRTEAVFTADSLDGEWVGGDVPEDDMDFFRQGVAQGGIVDTPSGEWYAMLFQDHGAVGRIPVLVPVVWENDFPKLLPAPDEIYPEDSRPGYVYRPLYGDDDFDAPLLNDAWEWNHEPTLSLVKFGAGELRLSTDRVDVDVEHARNTLTRRTFTPGCTAEIMVDGSGLHDGDFAGLCALEGLWAQIGLTREDGKLFIAVTGKTDEGIRETGRIAAESETVRLRAVFDFHALTDTVTFYYESGEEWKPLGSPHKMVYRLDHFAGVRIGLFAYSTKIPGGSAGFRKFRMTIEEPEERADFMKEG